MRLWKVEDHLYPYMVNYSHQAQASEKRDFFSCFHLENVRAEFPAGCQVLPHPSEKQKDGGFDYPDDLEAWQPSEEYETFARFLLVDLFRLVLIMCYLFLKK